ncbi:MAG: hypothetical protein GY904_26670 [Planctomycetaceae bacterium]|nr:hypothetical protein [Planctomycetaceae bacterium]
MSTRPLPPTIDLVCRPGPASASPFAIRYQRPFLGTIFGDHFWGPFFGHAPNLLRPGPIRCELIRSELIRSELIRCELIRCGVKLPRGKTVNDASQPTKTKPANAENNASGKPPTSKRLARIHEQVVAIGILAVLLANAAVSRNQLPSDTENATSDTTYRELLKFRHVKQHLRSH